MTDQDRINKVSKICEAIRKLSKKDLEVVQAMIDNQKNYTHPLKGGTAHRYNEMGRVNQNIIEGIKGIRSDMVELKSIMDTKPIKL